MDSLERLKRAIIDQVKANVPVQVLWAECVSANPEEGTMVAIREGLEYDDVLLGLGPDITVPAPGSKVLLGLVENQRTATWLIHAETVVERRINGNTYGGLVLADVAQAQDAAIMTNVNALRTALNAWTPTGNPVTDMTSLKAVFAAWGASALVPQPSNSYQNPVVSHG